jgi:predicted O-methyltransferase YrrM
MFKLRQRELMSNPSSSRRILDYDRRLLPNHYLAEVEEGVHDLASAAARTGGSVGYPAWNLLYYSLLSSLPAGRPAVVVETGTNLGFSTIVLAQALADGGHSGLVRTVEIDPATSEHARENVEHAGLSQFVKFAVGDSLAFLRGLDLDHVDFAFLDSDHQRGHVVQEFEILFPLVEPVRGKVYFDNTSAGGVAEALAEITGRFGGNLVEFAACSWLPPGNAIWQP